MSTDTADSSAGQRGPADHAIREQIVAAANDHFRHYGYGKTTVSALAKAIGFSKAYIYKFFESKRAIGEAICVQCLDEVLGEVKAAMPAARTASDRLRIFMRTLPEVSARLFFNERELYDIAAYSVSERWQSSANYKEQLLTIVAAIVVEGRASGEFERKTPLDETSRAICQVMMPFCNPLMLQYNLDALPDAADEVCRLVLRSLSP
ncbi:TetR/AcrR family transcriptional regulator [soil metagenome]